MSEAVELFKITIKDYFKNFFNPNAPITRDLYNRATFSIPFILSPILIALYIIVNKLTEKNEAYYKLPEQQQMLQDYQHHFILSLFILLVVFIMFIASLSLELRMYKLRNVKPHLFLTLNLIYFVFGLGYCLFTHFSGGDTSWWILLVGFILIGWSGNNGIFKSRSEAEVH